MSKRFLSEHPTSQVIVPGLCMINHNSGPEFATRFEYPAGSRNMQLLSQRAYAPGEQVRSLAFIVEVLRFFDERFDKAFAISKHISKHSSRHNH